MNHDHPVIQKMLEGWALTVALVLVFFTGYGIKAYEYELDMQSMQTAASYNASLRLMGLFGAPATTTATSTNPGTTTPKVIPQAILSVTTDKSEYPRNADVKVSWRTRIAPQKGLTADLIDTKGVSVLQFERIDTKKDSGTFAFVLDPKRTDENIFRIRIKDIASGVTAISKKFMLSAESLITARPIGKPTFYYRYQSSGSQPETMSVTYKVNFTNTDSVPVYFSKTFTNFIKFSIERGNGEGELVKFNPAIFDNGEMSLSYSCEGDTMYSAKFDVIKPGKTITCQITLVAAGSQISMNGHYFMRFAIEGFNFQKSMTSMSPIIVIKPALPMSLDVTQDTVLSSVSAIRAQQYQVLVAQAEENAVTQTANSLTSAQSLLTASVLPGLSVFAEGVLALLKK